MYKFTRPKGSALFVDVFYYSINHQSDDLLAGFFHLPLMWSAKNVDCSVEGGDCIIESIPGRTSTLVYDRARLNTAVILSQVLRKNTTRNTERIR